MEQVFEEWTAYAERKALQPREIDIGNVLKNATLKIIALTGVRRSGKSSLLILMHQKLVKEKKKSAYINLEDSRIKDNPAILDDIMKWFGDEGYLFLDEITNIRDWQGWLARTHEMLKGKLHLIVSSSRKSLAIPNKPLRGRMLPLVLYPLSFREFLDFKTITADKTTAGIGKLEKALTEYLKYGGFPEVVLTNDPLEKIKLLNTYFKDIIGLDVAEIAKEDITVVETFGKYIIDTSHFSASKCLNLFKSLGYKIGKQSILDLERHSQEGYLFFFVPIFSFTIKDRSQYPRKAYLGDTGFSYAHTGKESRGRLYENAVFIELSRRLPLQQEINYWKNQKGFETDFIIREGLKPTKLIQVTASIEEKDTRERELRGLVACAKELKCKEGLIISNTSIHNETIDGVIVTYLSLWKWLLAKH